MSVEGLKDFEVVSKSDSKKEKHARHSFFSCCGEVLIDEIIKSVFRWDFLRNLQLPYISK